MLELTGVVGQFNEVTILVAGDLMLDAYTFCSANRISPEAPVPVVRVEEEMELPGGAGNVMLNMAALGAKVRAMGRVGSDEAAESIINYFSEGGVDTTGILKQQYFSTPVKNRIIANHQQMIRIDHEQIEELQESLEQEMIEALPKLLENVDAIALSDYGKGTLTPVLLRAIIDQARSRGIPVVVDPKGVQYERYRGATLIKPNLGESYAAANIGEGVSLEKVAKVLLEKTEVDQLMITRSEKGISLFDTSGSHQNFPVDAKEVQDVTGAGDTVLAMVTFALANGLSYEVATRLANIAAGIAVEKLGCARVTMQQLCQRLLEIDCQNKVFHENHLSLLKSALVDQKLKVIGLSSEDDLSAHLLLQLFKHGKSSDHQLLIYLREEDPSEDFINVLASIQEVDFIILKSDSLRHLLEEIHPEEVYIYDGTTLQVKESIAVLL